MTIVKNQYKQVDEYLNHKSKIELSLETEVFLSFKHRTPNRYKLLDKIIRASITPEEELTDKTVYLGEKAKKLLRAILKKLFSNRYVLINHKYITQATRCKSDQNTIILKELESNEDFEKCKIFKEALDQVGIGREYLSSKTDEKEMKKTYKK